MSDLAPLLDACSAQHSHLCPRQVLGVRLGLAGADLLGITVPQADKRLLVIVETDGCFADGISVATGCTVGHRTLRVEDYGKVAAAFVDTNSGQAWRLAPRLDVRQRAWDYAPHERRRYFAQLQAYQVMPEELLLSAQPVQLVTPVEALVSRPGLRTACSLCGEEIINQRELRSGDLTLCRACAGDAYYRMPLFGLEQANYQEALLHEGA